MVQVDLITGFLGSGKTTFLRKYVQYLVAQGHNVCILENDFGAVNVDAMLLQDLIGDNCDLETISGGCDCDTHQRRMRTKLISMAMRGFDRVVIEPSGIFDVDEFYDILRDEPLGGRQRRAGGHEPGAAGRGRGVCRRGESPEPCAGRLPLRPPLWRRRAVQRLGRADRRRFCPH